MTPIRLYRPSNGTEGAGFHEEWCCECARDINEDCPIIAATFAYDVADPKYPQEWRYDDKGVPCCTAFIETGKPIPQPVDALTLDLFA